MRSAWVPTNSKDRNAIWLAKPWNAGERERKEETRHLYFTHKWLKLASASVTADSDSQWMFYSAKWCQLERLNALSVLTVVQPEALQTEMNSNCETFKPSPWWKITWRMITWWRKTGKLVRVNFPHFSNSQTKSKTNERLETMNEVQFPYQFVTKSVGTVPVQLPIHVGWQIKANDPENLPQNRLC